MNRPPRRTMNPQWPETERASADTMRIAAWIPLALLVAVVGCGDNQQAFPDAAAADATAADAAAADAAVPDAAAADAATDAAPMNVCGDGMVAGDEECDDGNDDEDDECLNDCTWACGDSVLPMDGDGCCPPTGNANNDDDCTPVCGNMVVETGEACDDGNVDTGDGCGDTCQRETVAFRIDSLQFRDPHFHVNLGIFGCRHITSDVDGLLAGAITSLGFNLVTVFRPLDQEAESTPLDIVLADCTAQADGITSCSQGGTAEHAHSTATNMTAGTCLEPLSGTTSGYNPPVTHSTAPCYVSDTEDMTLEVAGITLPLTDLQIAATYEGNPATGMTNGLLVGFLSETDAQASTVFISGVGTRTLANLLPGGAGNCASGDDRDTGPDGVTSGWWLYLNFTATAVPWTL